MTEEVNTELPPEEGTSELPAVEGQTSEQPEHSEAESTAMEKGWSNDKEKFAEVNPDKRWVSAEEYLDRESFFDKISSQSHKIQNLEKSMTELMTHNQDLETKTYDQAVRDTEIRLDRAAEEGDPDEYTKAKEEYKVAVNNVPKPTEVTPEPVSQEVVAFQDRNKSWFNATTTENQVMSQAAVGLEQLAGLEHPEYTDNQKLDYVEKKIKVLYPHRFENVQRDKPTLVANVDKTESGNSKSKPRVSYNELTSTQKDVYKTFVEHFGKDKSTQYLDQIADIYGVQK